MSNKILCEAILKDPPHHPIPNSNLRQFVVGYGSLMNEKSKLETHPKAGPSIPVIISGFERIWNANNCQMPAIYLDAQPNTSASFHGIIFEVFNEEEDEAGHELTSYDSREHAYNRLQVDPTQVEFLVSQSIFGFDPKNVEYWIYSITSGHSGLPTEKNPIRLNYLDKWICGCLELQDRYQIPNFAVECVKSTTGWRPFWVNNRKDEEEKHIATNESFEQMWIRVDAAIEQVLRDFKAYSQHPKLKITSVS